MPSLDLFPKLPVGAGISIRKGQFKQIRFAPVIGYGKGGNGVINCGVQTTYMITKPRKEPEPGQAKGFLG